MVKFHKNGKLERCALSHNQTIQGIPCASGRQLLKGEEITRPGAPPRDDVIVWRHIEMDENGRLSGCGLSANHKIQGKLFSRGKWISLDESGNPNP